MPFYLLYNQLMPVQINKITDKYITELGKKKVFKTVSFNSAVSSIRQAVEETSSLAKKEIKEAIEPFKNKIAQKDEFISQQGVNIKALEEKNNDLEKTNQKLHSEIKEKTDFLKQQSENNQELEKRNEELKSELELKELYLSKKESENTDLQSKLEIKDAFLAKKEQENQDLRKKSEAMSETVNRYKQVYKEAYRQGITPEIREQKSGLASIISGLVEHKTKPVKKPQLKQNPEPIIKTETQPLIEETKIPPKTDKVQEIKTKVKPLKAEPVITTTPTKAERKNSTVSIDKKVITFIENERKHQVLDKERIDKARIIIKALLEDAPTDSFRGIPAQFEKTKDKFIRPINNIIDRSKREFKKENYGLVRYDYDKDNNLVMKSRGLFDINKDAEPYKYELFNKDNSSIEIYDGNADSYIKFKDTEGKELLHIGYNSMESYYLVDISDKNGKSMITTSIKNGVVKYMRVDFNEVKSTSEIENDAPMNTYAQNIIRKAKENTISKTSIYRDTADMDYFNSDGHQTVKEYYVNKTEDIPPPKDAVPVFTYLLDPQEEKLEKLINTGDFGIHAKYDEKSERWIQYRTKGITGIDKYDKSGEKEAFGIRLHRDLDNNHFEVQSLYDEKYKGNNDSFQRPVYEKFNYGLASHPLTKTFTFYDLSQHNIKPWDFSIIKDYIK